MPVSGFGGYAYDAMHLLAEALPGTEGNKEKLRDALEKLKGHVGVTGTFNFSPQDHNGLGADAFVMVQIQKGTWKLLGNELALGFGFNSRPLGFRMRLV